MSEREWRPPEWGQHSGLGVPPIDPMPGYPWHPCWRPWPPWPPGDPPWLREKLGELIDPKDLIALQQAKMKAIEMQLKAQLEFVKAQTEAQLSLVGDQIEILSKYAKMK